MSDTFVQLGVKTQIEDCTYCPKMCRHSCPVSNASANETHTPQSKMSRLGELAAGSRPWSTASSDPLWACTGCRQCTTYCEHGNEPGLVLFAGRRQANERGYGHPRLAGYPDRFRNRDARLVGELRDTVPGERMAENASVGFWPGCDNIDKNSRGILQTLELFDHVGADHVRVVSAGQSCGGYPLLAAGYPDMFRWHAAKVASELRRYRTVIINCSACLYTLRVQYPAEGVELSCEVLSLSEFLARSSPQLAVSAEIQKKPVYYHDPCYLARYTGVIEPPRRVLQTVAEVREFNWSKTDADCCGGGGLLPKTMPRVADGMARRRLRDIAGRGGGTVVTSCATCAFMLRSNAPDGVDVYDLPELVAERVLGSGERDKVDDKP
ncbi:MAG: (Fe-S)-binding protein [Deltaproteobacteria bacterium]|nr:(Fe-S)-binding protein [Deltaproteobacteria bacterium]